MIDKIYKITQNAGADNCINGHTKINFVCIFNLSSEKRYY